jgi:hypothetical protein
MDNGTEFRGYNWNFIEGVFLQNPFSDDFKNPMSGDTGPLSNPQVLGQTSLPQAPARSELEVGTPAVEAQTKPVDVGCGPSN